MGMIEEPGHHLEEAKIEQQLQTNQQWCSQSHHRLPREVRDIIYSQTRSWNLDPLRLFRISLNEGITPNPKFFKPNSSETKDDYCQHFDVTILSILFLTEFIAYIYEATYWDFRDPTIVSIFLQRCDFTDVGLPAIQVEPWALVRHFSIVIRYDENKEQLLDLMRPLEAIKIKTALKLVIKCKFLPASNVSPVLDLVVPWIIKLKDRGYELNITLENLGMFLRIVEPIGSSMQDFKAWKSTWPEDVSFGVRLLSLWEMATYMGVS